MNSKNAPPRQSETTSSNRSDNASDNHPGTATPTQDGAA